MDTAQTTNVGDASSSAGPVLPHRTIRVEAALLQFFDLGSGQRVLLLGEADPEWEAELRDRCACLDRAADPDGPEYDLVICVPGVETVAPGDWTAHLGPAGQVLVVVDNPAGVARWAAGEAAMLPQSADAALVGALAGAGLVVDGWAGVFPDHRRARVVMTTALDEVDAQLCHRLPSFPSRVDGVGGPVVDEYRLFRQMVRGGGAAAACELAGSVVAWGHRGDTPGSPVWPEDRVAGYASADRSGLLTSMVRIRVTPTGGVFERSALAEPPGSTFHRRSLVEPYVTGTPLLELLEVAADDEVGEILRHWSVLVPVEESPGGAPLDLVPHNVLLGADGAGRAVDDDLRATGWRRSDLLARGALVTAVELTARGICELLPARTVGELVAQLGALIGLDGEWLPEAVERELQVLSEIGGARPGTSGLPELLAMERHRAHRGLVGLVAAASEDPAHVVALTEEVERLQRHSEGLAASLASAERTVADLEDHLAQVEADRRAIRDRADALEVDRTAVRAELARADADRAEAHAVLGRLHAESTEQRASMDRLQEHLAELRRRSIADGAEIDRARAERDRAWGMLDMVRWQRDNARVEARDSSAPELP